MEMVIGVLSVGLEWTLVLDQRLTWIPHNDGALIVHFLYGLFDHINQETRILSTNSPVHSREL
jgi:hypothetical protein